MVDLNLSDIQYYIFNPKTDPTSAEEKRVRQGTLRFWEEIWSERFESSGTPDPNWRNQFNSQTFVTSIWHKDEVLGCHLYSVHTLTSRSKTDIEYFKFIESDVLEKLKCEFGNTSMSMEYLCVNPAYSKNKLRFGIGKTLIMLGTLLAEELDIRSVLGMPIADTSVNRKVDECHLNAVVAQEEIKKYGYNLTLRAWSPKNYMKRIAEMGCDHQVQIWNKKKSFAKIDQLKFARMSHF